MGGDRAAGGRAKGRAWAHCARTAPLPRLCARSARGNRHVPGALFALAAPRGRSTGGEGRPRVTQTAATAGDKGGGLRAPLAQARWGDGPPSSRLALPARPLPIAPPPARRRWTKHHSPPACPLPPHRPYYRCLGILRGPPRADRRAVPPPRPRPRLIAAASDDLIILTWPGRDRAHQGGSPGDGLCLARRTGLPLRVSFVGLARLNLCIAVGGLCPPRHYIKQHEAELKAPAAAASG